MNLMLRKGTVRIKKNAIICEIFALLFDKIRIALLWFVWEAPGYGIAAFFFAKRAANFAKRTVIFAKRAAIRRLRSIFTIKGPIIQGLWRFTRRCTVALLVGEKRSECRLVFKCRCSVFVAFFLKPYCIYGF